MGLRAYLVAVFLQLVFGLRPGGHRGLDYQ